MNELFDISILAKGDDGIIEIVFFVVIILFGFIANVVTKFRKKQQEQEEEQRFAELQDTTKAVNNEDDEWDERMQEMHIREDLESISTPAPPVQVEKPQQKIATFGDFVKSARQQFMLQQDTHKPEPVPVQLKSTRIPQPPIPSSRPPKIIRHGTEGKSSRLTTPRDHNDVHRTVPCEGVSDSAYLPPSATAIHLDATAARKAIIYHEILSPPKALRENCEMWD